MAFQMPQLAESLANNHDGDNPSVLAESKRFANDKMVEIFDAVTALKGGEDGNTDLEKPYLKNLLEPPCRMRIDNLIDTFKDARALGAGLADDWVIPS